VALRPGDVQLAIVHVSDLHCGESPADEILEGAVADLRSEALAAGGGRSEISAIEDLASLLPGAGKAQEQEVALLSIAIDSRLQSICDGENVPIACVVSGDLTRWGRRSEFRNAHRVITSRTETVTTRFHQDTRAAGLGFASSARIPGNHDHFAGDSLALQDLLLRPCRRNAVIHTYGELGFHPSGARDPGGAAWGPVDLATRDEDLCVRLLGVDSNSGYADRSQEDFDFGTEARLAPELPAWLVEAALAPCAQARCMRALLHHHPLHAVNFATARSDVIALRNCCIEADIAAIFSGHEHRFHVGEIGLSRDGMRIRSFMAPSALQLASVVALVRHVESSLTRISSTSARLERAIQSLVRVLKPRAECGALIHVIGWRDARRVELQWDVHWVSLGNAARVLIAAKNGHVESIFYPMRGSG